MKIFKNLSLSIVGLVSILLSAASGVSSAVAQEQNLKIGYLNANIIVAQAPQGVAAFDELKRKYAGRENDLRQLESEIQTIDEKLDNPAKFELSGEEILQLQEESRIKSRELERGVAEFNEDFNWERNQELEKLQKTVSNLIYRMADEQEFDLIVQDPIIWVSDRINLTDEVLAELQVMFDESVKSGQ
jgi:outer membrane protein